MPRTRHTIATVVDCHPRFRIELILWALCIHKTFPASDFRRVVYFIDDAPADLTGWLEDRGFEWRVVAAPAPQSPHCNKLLPFLEEQPSDYVLVTDADLYFVANPAALVAASAIQAAPNNHCNPPGRVFRDLFRHAGFEQAYKPGVSLMEGSGGHRETYLNNINAGIVCMPSATAASFAPVCERPPQPALTALIASRVDTFQPVFKEATHGSTGRSAEVRSMAATAAAVHGIRHDGVQVLRSGGRINRRLPLLAAKARSAAA